jgi:DNA-binding LacI/PurR family transcriptional regulator
MGRSCSWLDASALVTGPLSWWTADGPATDMADRVTSAQVAAMAGVSQSAVSRVFTPGASVSAPHGRERSRLRPSSSATGPNVLARAMITGRSRMIGLVVAYLDNQFYPVALERLSRALQAAGYHVLIFMADNDAAKTDEVVRELSTTRWTASSPPPSP